jgi:hypothetical protein
MATATKKKPVTKPKKPHVDSYLIAAEFKRGAGIGEIMVKLGLDGTLEVENAIRHWLFKLPL